MKIADKTTSAVDMVKEALKKAEHFSDYYIFTYLNTENALKKAQEIDEKISELQKMKLLARSGEFKPKEIVKEHDFNKVDEADVFDYQTFSSSPLFRQPTLSHLPWSTFRDLFRQETLRRSLRHFRRYSSNKLYVLSRSTHPDLQI